MRRRRCCTSRQNSGEAAECILVLIGPTPEGKKELGGFQTEVRESPQSWRELLIDIKQCGLEIAPDLACERLSRPAVTGISYSCASALLDLCRGWISLAIRPVQPV